MEKSLFYLIFNVYYIYGDAKQCGHYLGSEKSTQSVFLIKPLADVTEQHSVNNLFRRK